MYSKIAVFWIIEYPVLRAKFKEKGGTSVGSVYSHGKQMETTVAIVNVHPLMERIMSLRLVD